MSLLASRVPKAITVLLSIFKHGRFGTILKIVDIGDGSMGNFNTFEKKVKIDFQNSLNFEQLQNICDSVPDSI